MVILQRAISGFIVKGREMGTISLHITTWAHITKVEGTV